MEYLLLLFSRKNISLPCCFQISRHFPSAPREHQINQQEVLIPSNWPQVSKFIDAIAYSWVFLPCIMAIKHCYVRSHNIIINFPYLLFELTQAINDDGQGTATQHPLFLQLINS